MKLSPGQQMMLDDGAPAFCFIPQERRAEAWKGRKLTRQGSSFNRLDAAEQRERNKLQREYDRMQEQKKRDRLAALKERFND